LVGEEALGESPVGEGKWEFFGFAKAVFSEVGG
jgi:hypothetical protein